LVENCQFNQHCLHLVGGAMVQRVQRWTYNHRLRVQILLRAMLCNNLGQVAHTYASVTKQYNLVLAKRRWCFAAGKVTAGLVESNSSLPPGGWLTVTCGLTACTPGSAPGLTIGIEYGKPLPFTFLTCIWCPSWGTPF